MANTINMRGTSYPSFMIGRRGVTLYQGSVNNINTGTKGDIFINSSSPSIEQYDGTNWNELLFSNTNLNYISDLILTDGYLKVSTTGFSVVTKETLISDIGLGTSAYINTGTTSGTIPVLDSNGKISSSMIPSMALTNVSVVDTEDEKPTSANEGDVVVVSDTSKTYICSNGSTTSPTWIELQFPTSFPVSSVNSLTGAVVLNGSNIDSSYNSTNFTITSGSTIDEYFAAIDSSIGNINTKTGNLGTAATADIGTDEGNVAVLSSNGVFDISLIPNITTVSLETSGTISYPTSPRTGDVVINQPSRTTYIYDGTTWDQILYSGIVSVNGITGSTSTPTDGIVILNGTNINGTYVPSSYTLDKVSGNPVMTLDSYFKAIDLKISDFTGTAPTYIQDTVNSNINKVDTSTNNVTITANGGDIVEFSSTVTTGEKLTISNDTGKVIIEGTGAETVDVLINPSGDGLVILGTSENGTMTTDSGVPIVIQPGASSTSSGANVSISAGDTTAASSTGGILTLGYGTGTSGNGDIQTVTGFTPQYDMSIANKKYVDTSISTAISSVASGISSVSASQNITANISGSELVISGPDLSGYLPLSGGTLTGNIQGTTAGFSGTVYAETQTIDKNDTSVATTAWVCNVMASLETVINGDISTVGNSISLTIPNENIIMVLTSTSTTSAQITYAAVSGTVSPVDIRRVTIWGGAGVESYTLDGGTLTTTPTMADDTIYTQSNDSSAHFIRVNGNIYVITIWCSGNGARSSMMYRKLI